METKSKNPRTGAPVLRAVLPNTARPLQVIHESDAISKLSLLIFGLGNLVNRQIGRGLILLAIEAGYIAYMAAFGIAAMGDFSPWAPRCRRRSGTKPWASLCIRRAITPCCACCTA